MEIINNKKKPRIRQDRNLTKAETCKRHREKRKRLLEELIKAVPEARRRRILALYG